MLPRLLELDAQSRSRAAVVLVDLTPHAYFAGGSLYLMDAAGTALACERLRLVVTGEPAVREIATRYLHLVGLHVEGEWIVSEDPTRPRHYARVVAESTST